MTYIQTETLRFLDACNFISPGFSYEAYLTAHGASLSKGFFPYEWMDSIDKLNEHSLPPKEAFYSQLTGKDISHEDYETVTQGWKNHNMNSVRDLLVWYNNLDVQAFLEALEKQHSIYATRTSTWDVKR